MAKQTLFNVQRRGQVIEDIFVEFTLMDGRVVSIMCDNSADAERLASLDVHGIDVEFD